LTELSSNVEPNFAYELTTVPAALFKESNLRKSVTSDLAEVITKDIDTSGQNMATSMFVLDGGC
jgi:hypothetical protein